MRIGTTYAKEVSMAKGEKRVTALEVVKKFIHCLLFPVVAVLLSSTVWAAEINTGSEDVQLRWDNSLRYTLSQRLKGQDKAEPWGN